MNSFIAKRAKSKAEQRFSWIGFGLFFPIGLVAGHFMQPWLSAQLHNADWARTAGNLIAALFGGAGMGLAMLVHRRFLSGQRSDLG